MSLPTPFLRSVEQLIPCERRFDDALSTLAFGTDASFYRLIPQLVIRVESEDEVVALLQLAGRDQVPVTFRAAGTSLSGQAISDSVLIVLGDHWNGREIRQQGRQIRLQPGVIGAQANAWLAPFGRKIGPDPASINACKIGGIVANNASGMCCGTAQNTYHTLAGIRLVLADGSRLDTEDPTSVATFRQSHGELLEQLATLARETRANSELATKIRHKYRLKNTTGLSLNALVDFDEPLDILSHLLVGSEGTLGFISAVTYNTVIDHPHKASALIVFPDVETCCTAVTVLKRQPVSAVELLDRRSLRSVQDKPGMPAFVRELSDNACALLIESRAASSSLLHEQLAQIMASLARFPVEKQVDFTEDPTENAKLWAIRKDTFPAVGAVRQTGTTVIIEDVTFPVEQLAIGVNRLIELFDKHHYDEAILFGHALEGNLHFVFTQGFNSAAEVARYQAFMDDVAHLVAVEFGGSLKAEHGTGRNMAPFVEKEWGSDAYQLMWAIKRLLDPQGILNPDVVLSDDPQAAAGRRRNHRQVHRVRLLRTGLPLQGTDPQPAPTHRHLARHPGEKTRRRRHQRTGGRLPLPGYRHLRRHRPVRPALPGGHQHRRTGEKAAWPRSHSREARRLAGDELRQHLAGRPFYPACRQWRPHAARRATPGSAVGSADANIQGTYSPVEQRHATARTSGALEPYNP